MNSGPQYKRQAEKYFARAREHMDYARGIRANHPGDAHFDHYVAMAVRWARHDNHEGVRCMRRWHERAAERAEQRKLPRHERLRIDW